MEMITLSGVTSCTLLVSDHSDAKPFHSPRVNDHIHIVAGESLLGVLRDLLRVRVEDMVAALDHSNLDLVFQNFWVLRISTTFQSILSSTHVFKHIFSHHVRQFSRKFHTGGSTARNDEGQQAFTVCNRGSRQRGEFEVG